MTFAVHQDVLVAMRNGLELATDLSVPETDARADAAGAPARQPGPAGPAA